MPTTEIGGAPGPARSVSRREPPKNLRKRVVKQTGPQRISEHQNPKDAPTETAQVMLRVTPEMYYLVKDIAAREDRSSSAVYRALLNLGIRAYQHLFEIVPLLGAPYVDVLDNPARPSRATAVLDAVGRDLDNQSRPSDIDYFGKSKQGVYITKDGPDEAAIEDAENEGMNPSSALSLLQSFSSKALGKTAVDPTPVPTPNPIADWAAAQEDANRASRTT